KLCIFRRKCEIRRFLTIVEILIFRELCKIGELSKMLKILPPSRNFSHFSPSSTERESGILRNCQYSLKVEKLSIIADFCKGAGWENGKSAAVKKRNFEYFSLSLSLIFMFQLNNNDRLLLNECTSTYIEFLSLFPSRRIMPQK